MKLNFKQITLVSSIVAIIATLFFAKNIKDTMNEKDAVELTKFGVANPTEDTIKGYLTLNSGKNYVEDVNGIFGIVSTKKLQGEFTLNPNDTLWYTTTDGKVFSGNVTFNDVPLNCPKGITQYEFTLNNYGSAPLAQETIDISCVAGVSTIGKFILSGGGNWNDGVHTKPIKSFQNDSLYHNTNVSGVFPYGCTNCTFISNPPNCGGKPSYAEPSSKPLCNVQRDASESGGSVLVVYMSKIY